MAPPRRELDELLALYEYEPTLRDVYVEGPSDAEFLAWFLRRNGVNAPSVYEIDVVDVPRDLLAKYKLTSGRRSSVIALAIATFGYLGDPALQVTCLVDRDLDDVRGNRVNIPNLVFTDYSSIELYAYDEPALDRLLSLFAGGVPLSPGDLLGQLAPILRTLYAMRAASVESGLNLTWLSFEGSCTFGDATITFDAKDFEKRYLMKSGEMKSQELFRKSMKDIEGILSDDDRSCIHGHDFVNILTWVLPKMKKRLRGLSAEAMSGALLMAAEPSELDKAPALLAILNRVSS